MNFAHFAKLRACPLFAPRQRPESGRVGQARLIELAPRHYDVIVRRWRTFTGGHAPRAIP
jgi:hypothetical protein